MEDIRRFHETEPQCRFGHVAIRLEHHILIFGGKRPDHNFGSHKFISNRELWMCNLYTKQWGKYVIPDREVVPPAICYACAVVIDQTVYMFGGYIKSGRNNINDLWKLTKSSDVYFVWNKIAMQENMKAPSPRRHHAGWAYAGNLWSFGGFCDLVNQGGYLHDHGDFEGPFNNQLVCFNPCMKEWTNPRCFGSIPTPGEGHACAKIEDEIWFYGGFRSYVARDKLYQLDIHSLVWTQIQTTCDSQPEMKVYFYCSLSSITHSKLVLHGGTSSLPDTWILDIPSLTWSKYLSKDHYRQSHTATIGLNNDVIITGGLNKHSDAHPTYNITYHVMLEPMSLQQLAIQTVHKYPTMIPWRTLKKLLPDK